jgi:hypothetical protein
MKGDASGSKWIYSGLHCAEKANQFSEVSF